MGWAARLDAAALPNCKLSAQLARPVCTSRLSARGPPGEDRAGGGASEPGGQGARGAAGTDRPGNEVRWSSQPCRTAPLLQGEDRGARRSQGRDIGEQGGREGVLCESFSQTRSGMGERREERGRKLGAKPQRRTSKCFVCSNRDQRQEGRSAS